MPFTITAELPLGTYRGAGQDGRSEPMPSVARLHAALLSAAGFGPRAVPKGGDLAPCDDDDAALRWLEDHPPDGVSIPPLEVNRARATAYRDDGTIKKSGAVLATKKLPKAAGVAVAVKGRFRWSWMEVPPEPVRQALEALCPDVPYLGTTESPVRLVADVCEDDEVTHHRDLGADLLSSGGEFLDVPSKGRTRELREAHARNMGRAPSAARDSYRTDEKSLSSVPPRAAVEVARYVSRHPGSRRAPWSQVVVIPLDRFVPEPYRVPWAAAAHRALIKLVDEGAPPLLTGSYPEGVARPVNRIALQFVERVDASTGEEATSLAVLIPADSASADVATVMMAIEGLGMLRGPGGRTARVVDEPYVVPGDSFWEPPQVGYLRLWRTAPAAVPDTRGPAGSQWSFAQAVLLSVGYVWKGFLSEVPGRRDDYQRNLAAAVADHAVAVVQVRAVRESQVGSYVHRVHEHAVVRPYWACVSLGDLAGTRVIQAIGQSRHLGGGLLVPFDVPEGTPLDDVRLPLPGGMR